MDDHGSSLLTWSCSFQGKGVEELKNSLLCTTLELESTRMAAQEELRRRDEQVRQLRELLSRVVKERDDAQQKCLNFLLDTVLLRPTPPPSAVSNVDDEPRRGMDSNNAFSSSDGDESIVSSPAARSDGHAAPEKPLPEKGKLLQAVMKAGPLLQTLLLAGPLPQWRHPPPAIDVLDIPPFSISSHLFPNKPDPTDSAISRSCSSVDVRKRGSREDVSASPRGTKFQRVALH